MTTQNRAARRAAARQGGGEPEQAEAGRRVEVGELFATIGEQLVEIRALLRENAQLRAMIVEQERQAEAAKPQPE